MYSVDSRDPSGVLEIVSGSQSLRNKWHMAADCIYRNLYGTLGLVPSLYFTSIYLLWSFYCHSKVIIAYFALKIKKSLLTQLYHFFLVSGNGRDFFL